MTLDIFFFLVRRWTLHSKIVFKNLRPSFLDQLFHAFFRVSVSRPQWLNARQSSERWDDLIFLVVSVALIWELRSFYVY